MDWNKTGAIAGIVCALLAVVTFGRTVWPWPQIRAQRENTGDQRQDSTPFPVHLRLMAGFIIASFALSAISIYLSWSERNPNIFDYPLHPHEEVIEGRKFVNETVEVDGKRFDHCEFTNATLIYHGLSSYLFDEAKFYRSVQLETDNISIAAFERLQQTLHTLPGITHVFTGLKDKNGNVSKISEYFAPNELPQKR